MRQPDRECTVFLAHNHSVLMTLDNVRITVRTSYTYSVATYLTSIQSVDVLDKTTFARVTTTVYVIATNVDRARIGVMCTRRTQKYRDSGIFCGFGRIVDVMYERRILSCHLEVY